MMYQLTGSIHKGSASSSHIGHNRRSVPVPHSDKNRTPLNETFRDIPIEEAYHSLFDDALREYNQGKKPSRQIADYYEHIMKLYADGEKKVQEARLQGATRKRQARLSSTYQKPYSELIVSVGNIDAYNGVFRNGGEQENLSLGVLREYINSFEERNPNLYVFGAYLHRDESGVPHLHIDYIAWSDEPTSRGLSKRLSESGAFRQMGLGDETTFGTIAFQEREREALSEIARRHGIQIIEGKHTKKHLSKEEYVLHKEQEKVGIASRKVNESARELLQSQDEFARFLQDNRDGKLYSEVATLRENNKAYIEMLSSDAELMKKCWDEFNSATSEFFSNYRKQKAELYAEMQKAREDKRANVDKINSLLSSILFDSDLLIVKIIKLFSLLRHYVKGAMLEGAIEHLQSENEKMKSTAKSIMSVSKDVGDTLRSREYEKILKSLEEYEKQITSAIDIINRINTVELNCDNR